jgi:endonuclease YncB( thermonuclease family)
MVCTNGVHIRLAGVDAAELHGGCHAECPAMSAMEAKRYIERITYRQTLMCKPNGRSYERIVASCRFRNGEELGCKLLAVGGAVRVWRYWMPACD